jgi:hypothetical protein
MGERNRCGNGGKGNERGRGSGVEAMGVAVEARVRVVVRNS